jgi:hypothetical protein
VIPLAALAAAELVLIGFLVWERHRAHPDLAPLLAMLDGLCQRVAAPGAAVIAYDEAHRPQPPETYAPPALEPDDDDSYWMSRDRLADYAMRQEVASDGGVDRTE